MAKRRLGCTPSYKPWDRSDQSDNRNTACASDTRGGGSFAQQIGKIYPFAADLHPAVDAPDWVSLWGEYCRAETWHHGRGGARDLGASFVRLSLYFVDAARSVARNG